MLSNVVLAALFRTSIKHQLRIAVSLLCALLVASVGSAVWSIYHLKSDVVTTIVASTAREHIASDIAVAALQCRRFEKDMFLNLADAAQYTQYRTKWRAAYDDLRAAVDSYSAFADEPTVRQRVAIWRGASGAYETAMQDIDRAIRTGAITTPAAANAALTPSKQHVRQLTESAVAVANDEQAAIQAHMQAATRTATNLLAMMVVLGAILLICALGWSVFFPPRLLRPLAELQSATQHLARGDFHTRLDVRRSDEIGSLQTSFNVMAATIEQQRAGLIRLDVAEAARAEAEAAHRALAEKVAMIELQRNVIREMSVPVLPVSPHTLVMPLIGALDTERLVLVQGQALQALEQAAVRTLILDVTGVPVVDNHVAQGLLQVVQAARLLGAQVILVGIRPEVAQSLVGLGAQLTGITTRVSLQDGIAYARRMSTAPLEGNADANPNALHTRLP